MPGTEGLVSLWYSLKYIYALRCSVYSFRQMQNNKIRVVQEIPKQHKLLWPQIPLKG